LVDAVLFILAGSGATVFLADRSCGAKFSHYGCDVPTANSRNEDAAVAPPQRLRRGTRKAAPRL
jgi:hypothetical protein